MTQMTKIGDNQSAHPVDLHVGRRIRLRRKGLDMNQQTLAHHLDLTFQQIQKYERGVNRISAAKLYQAAQTLNVPVGYFFIGVGTTDNFESVSKTEQDMHEFLMASEGIELAAAFPPIRNAKLRRLILELVKILAEDDSNDDKDLDHRSA